jgi:hypothetical protein
MAITPTQGAECRKKVNVIWEIENGGGVGVGIEAEVSGIWPCKFYDPNNMEKQNKNY